MGEMSGQSGTSGPLELPGRAQRGTNQAGMRAYNERLVLTLVRRHKALAKSEIARMTGLSAQTVSVIMRQLEADELLIRGEPQRGRVGQPSVPLSINPDGAYFIGAKVGRRSLEMVLVDFAGGVRRSTRQAYAYPTPEATIRSIRAEIQACMATAGIAPERIAGLGVAIPFQLWAWVREIDADAGQMDAWRYYDLRAELAAELPYPVYLQNDATAACGAELAFGGNSDLSDFIHLYVGAFIGGGVVLNRGLYPGRTGNAGAIGAAPIPDGTGGSVPLFDRASLVLLERQLIAADIDTSGIYSTDSDWARFGTHLDDWLGKAGHAIAHAVASAAAVIDFEAAVIDGSFPPDVQARLLGKVRSELSKLNLTGLEPPAIRAGTIGPIARALGGASLPLFNRYLLDQHDIAGS